MRFMIIVRATPETEAAAEGSPLPALQAYHALLARAGVLLEGHGLKPSRQGWRIRFVAGGGREVIDGPFADPQALIAGYTLIQVRTREEAMEWARRFPAPNGERTPAEIEVRELYEA